MYFSIDRLPSFDDPFFHIRFAEILKEKGFDAFRDFHWIYFSKISINQSYFIYYNFLFYLAVIPFTFIKPLFLAMKLYGIFFSSLSFTLLFVFLLKMKEKYAFLWTLLLFSIINYLLIIRFIMMRPFTLAPALLIVLIYFLYKKKYLFVFLLTFFYFYWHTATFFFPLIVSGTYFLFESFYGKKLDWKIIWSCLGAIILAFTSSVLFAPGLFYYMKDVIIGVFVETILGNKVNIAEGNELYPANFINFFRNNSVVVSMFTAAVVFEIYRYVQEKKGNFIISNNEEISKRSIKGTLFFLSILFFLGTFLSSRNGDYFIFFSAVYIAISFNYILTHIVINNAIVKESLFIGLVIVVVYLFSANFLFIQDQIASSGAYDGIEGTANWLKNNTSEGDIVFNASWNWFPTLFYYNTHNNYVAGIEPRFLYDYSPKMYWAWWNISNKGYLCYEEECAALDAQRNYNLKKNDKKNLWYKEQGDKIASVIKDNFQSRYIVSSKSLANFNEIMDNNNHFEKVFSDKIYNQFYVYKVN